MAQRTRREGRVWGAWPHSRMVRGGRGGESKGGGDNGMAIQRRRGEDLAEGGPRGGAGPLGRVVSGCASGRHWKGTKYCAKEADLIL